MASGHRTAVPWPRRSRAPDRPWTAHHHGWASRPRPARCLRPGPPVASRSSARFRCPGSESRPRPRRGPVRWGCTASRSRRPRGSSPSRSAAPRASTAPTRATGTSCPTARFCAPHTMPSGSASPTSTLVIHRVSALGWRSTDRTRPTTTPSQAAPPLSMLLTSNPSMRQAHGQFLRRHGHVDVLAQPLHGDAHRQRPPENCSRKRRSALISKRRSGMPWRSRVKRSNPIPNA